MNSWHCENCLYFVVPFPRSCYLLFMYLCLGYCLGSKGNWKLKKKKNNNRLQLIKTFFWKERFLLFLFFKARRSQYVKNRINALKLIKCLAQLFLILCQWRKDSVSSTSLLAGLWNCFCTFLFIFVWIQIRFPFFHPDNIVLPLRNQASGFLIKSSKPNTQGL